MKKILVCISVVCMTIGVFAQGPRGSQTPGDHHPMMDSLIRHAEFQFDTAESRHMFDSLMVRNRERMDSLPALHNAMIQFSRCRAERAYDSLHAKVVRRDIDKDSLDKVINGRRNDAQTNLKLAIEDLKNLKEKQRTEIEQARQELKGRIEDKQKDVKGGIDVALARLEQAKQNLETKATAAKDAETLAKIQEAIKRLDAIETHLKDVKAR
jgi:hypothetical protein